MDLQRLALAMEPIVRRAGTYVKTAVPLETKEKSNHNDLVTEFDVNTQRMLTEELQKLYPAAKFMGEEEHLEADVTTGDCFVIDPIDGTTNFVMGFDHSAVSVALLRDGKPGIGIVYNPWSQEYFSAVKGQGAFCNGRPIHVRDCPLKDAVLGFGTAIYYPDLVQKTLKILSEALKTVIDVRRMGSASLDICDAAMGRTSVFFELKLSPWDYAAAGLILTESGGQITDDKGTPISFEHPCPIVAGSKQACEDLIKLIKKIENKGEE